MTKSWYLIAIACISCRGTDDSNHRSESPPPLEKSKRAEVTRSKTAKRPDPWDQFDLSREVCEKKHDFVDAIKQVSPVVVGVAAGEMTENRFEPKSIGTGIILSRNGLIITHQHTVLDHTQIRIRLADGEIKKAEWLGEDRQSDLVMLKIEGKGHDLPTIASADSIVVGQWVASIGGPYGVQQSVSAGLVSDNNRLYPSPMESKLVRFIQSDVVIHPGSSGGPLFDSCGRIVGMNSMILGPGLSFSLRIDEAMIIARKLVSEGEFDRGFIGLVLKKSRKGDPPNRIQIKRVIKGSPAELVGLRSGDLITTLNGEDLRSPHHLKWLVAITEPGDAIKLKIIRQGSPMTISVEVDSSP